MKTIRAAYIVLFSISIGLILWYLCNLFHSGYIDWYKNFDLNTASNISPFLGNFVAPIISLASALLVLENLIEFKNSNLETKRKNSTELTLQQCQIFLIDIQQETKSLADKNIPGSAIASANYLEEPLTSQQITSNPIFKEIVNLIAENHANIVLYLNKIEYVSSCFLHGDANTELGNRIIGKTFIAQVKNMLPYIAYYRADEESLFCENTVELYKKWGGVISPILEQIEY